MSEPFTPKKPWMPSCDKCGSDPKECDCYADRLTPEGVAREIAAFGIDSLGEDMHSFDPTPDEMAEAVALLARFGKQEREAGRAEGREEWVKMIASAIRGKK